MHTVESSKPPVEFFTAEETAVLEAFFAIPAPSPTSDTRICALGYGFGNAEIELVNAVALIALANLQARLPQWACVHADGRILFGRDMVPRRTANVLLLPQHLFTINWGDSGPGFSWPEAYHVALVPGYGRYLVTASQDSTDSFGVCDEAIGSFPVDVVVREGVRQVISAWWRSMFEGYEQARWAYLFDEGTINSAEAYGWADEVWGPEYEDDSSDGREPALAAEPCSEPQPSR